MHSSTARVAGPVRRGSLLIVDDESSLVEAISRYLGRQGYEVYTAGTARAALAQLAHAPVDVMLCDVGLPDMEATELVQSACATAPDMTVLMFSGWHDQDLADELFSVGASAYVTKPLPLQALRDVVDKAILERRDRR